MLQIDIKKRSFLLAIAVIGIFLCFCIEQPLYGQNDPNEAGAGLFANDPNFAFSSGDLGTNELFYNMITAVLVVIALGVAAIYFSKKFLPKIANLSGRNIQLVETLNLGTRKSIHLIRVGQRRLLIGSSADKISHLADVTDEFVELQSEETQKELK
jgi:flagellar biosynthetic protein FliO